MMQFAHILPFLPSFLCVLTSIPHSFPPRLPLPPPISLPTLDLIHPCSPLPLSNLSLSLVLQSGALIPHTHSPTLHSPSSTKLLVF
ncbi:hypothetical protein E2C01_033261 [Portunus trituberculatus]|uniref:Secreted protein n=1 Tax=Portunus trituberculatus TaxID=210409 RepID=A0A5B7F533_PORTR|nr:hypothetical protein [Portunus trituberculatus]